MPLRLRRGTNTERQLITPQEGELIYVTDTKELWAGDGTTQGGIKVTGNIPENLNDLGDVDLSVAPQIGQVLKWNGAAFVAANDIDTDTDTAGIVEGSNYRINIVSDDSTVMVNTSNRTFEGNLTGDVVGSVFADDSSVFLDSINKNINTDNIFVNSTVFTEFIETSGPQLKIMGPENTRIQINVLSSENYSSLKLTRSSEDLINDSSEAYGIIQFEKLDDNGILTTSLIRGGDALLLGADPLGVFEESKYLVWTDGNLGIGTFSPTETLDVNGSAKVSGTIQAAGFIGSVFADDSATIVDGITGSITAQSFVQFGNLTSIERDELSPSNGMIIYNTTTHKFQGFQNGIWINLDDGSAV